MVTSNGPPGYGKTAKWSPRFWILEHCGIVILLTARISMFWCPGRLSKLEFRLQKLINFASKFCQKCNPEHFRISKISHTIFDFHVIFGFRSKMKILEIFHHFCQVLVIKSSPSPLYNLIGQPGGETNAPPLDPR